MIKENIIHVYIVITIVLIKIFEPPSLGQDCATRVVRVGFDRPGNELSSMPTCDFRSTAPVRNASRKSPTRALTLIELVIAIAIIGILAAIVGYNFQQAAVRSKVSRVHSDLRVLATASEAYYVDNNSYPSNDLAFVSLMYPVAYIHDAFIPDPFDAPEIYFLLNTSANDSFAVQIITAAFPYDYEAQSRFFQQGYLFTSAGPDGKYLVETVDGDPYDEVVDADFVMWLQSIGTPGGAIYDPSNGTISPGDIGRTSKGVASPTLFR